MPENNNDNFQDLNLPKKTEVNPEELEKTIETEEVSIKVEGANNEKIVIPQEYYEKLDEEKAEKEAKEKEIQEAKEITAVNMEESKKMFSLAIVNLVIYTILIYSMIKVSEYIIYVIPAYMIVMSAINAVKDKTNSNQTISSLIGGIIGATFAYFGSLIIEAKEDTLIYYTFALAVCGILGMITSGVITYAIAEKEKVKALGTIGIIIYIGLLFGTPFGLSKYYSQPYYKYVFGKQAEIKAVTEKDFIEKQLKARYGLDFTCDDGKRINNITQKTPTSQRNCTLVNKTKSAANNRDTTESKDAITVISIAYNETEVLYIVEDNYMDKVILDDFTSSLTERLNSVTSANTDIAFYPKTGCLFVGDCHDCDEYTKAYKRENDKEYMYQFSKELNFEKYLNMKGIDFINEYEFKYIIEVSGKFGGLQTSNYEGIVEKIIEELEQTGMKNNYGFEIIIKNSEAYNKPVYKVIGEPTNDKSFTDYNIEEV